MKDNLVVKHNDLVTASYAMTRHEQNLLLSCISQIDSRKRLDEGHVFTLTVEQARDLFYNGNDQYNAYRDLKTASERLFERKIRIQLDNGKELLTRFVQSVIFDPDAGAVNIRFATDIYPYLSELEKNFTKYRLANIVQLTSVYAVRLYELLICWLGQGLHNKEFDIDDFRRLMGVDDKYSQFGQLKDRVITPALEQINEFTDHEIRVSYRKVGRTFRFIRFSFNVKDREKSKAIETTTKPSKRSKTQNRPLSEPFRDPNTLDLFTGQTDTESKNIPSWQLKGLSDAQIKKIGVYKQEFIDANTSKISPNDRRGYDEIFESWEPLLKDPNQVKNFKIVQDLLERKRQN